jgi:hypothetical protein
MLRRHSLADRFCEAMKELTAERQTRTYAAQWIMVHSVARHLGISDDEAQEAIQAAGHRLKRVAVIFDQGIYSDSLKAFLERWTYPLGRPRVSAIGAATVESLSPLQGADIVATENYWHMAPRPAGAG